MIVTEDCWKEKDLEGTGHGLIEIFLHIFGKTEEYHVTSQSGLPMSLAPSQ
jgi:hypothetical protein